MESDLELVGGGPCSWIARDDECFAKAGETATNPGEALVDHHGLQLCVASRVIDARIGSITIKAFLLIPTGWGIRFPEPSRIHLYLRIGVGDQHQSWKWV